MLFPDQYKVIIPIEDISFLGDDILMKIPLWKSILVSALLLAFLLSGAGAMIISIEGQSFTFKRRITADTSLINWIDCDGLNIVASADVNNMEKQEGTPVFEKENACLQPGESVSIEVFVPAEGDYAILLEYKVLDGQMENSTATVTVGNQTVNTFIYGLWQDETKIYNHDRYGNEVTPNQRFLDEYVTDYVRNARLLDLTPVTFHFKSGTSFVVLGDCDVSIKLRTLKLVALSEAISYEEYVSFNPINSMAKSMIVIEAEDYAVKSDSYIRCQSKQNAAVYPYSPYKRLLSTIDCGSYNSVGQRIVWNFTVPEDGWYYIAFHFSQPQKEGMSTYRDIEIDGKVLFSDLAGVGFPYTGNGYKNLIVKTKKDNEPVKIYLTKGVHTFGLFTHAPNLQASIDEITSIISELTDIGLSLKQVAGNSPDRTRLWDIETYIPGIIDRLKDLQSRLLALYDEMGKQMGATPSSCIDLKTAAGIIKQALKKPNKLPAKISELSTGNGSATALLASLQNKIRQQGIALDRIYLFGDNQKLPRESANLAVTFSSGVKRFVYSLFNRDSAYAVTTAKNDVLSVWVNRSVTHVETLQFLVDSYFTPKTGIKVQLSVMPDANKLILANASDTCPDVALGVGYDIPYQLGLRGAASDLTNFADFATFAESSFNLADLEPYVYDGKFYGLPETMQFYVLMYRTVILEKLELSVPQTWSDVVKIMPVLRRNGMTFYIPLSSYTGVKGLDGILPFFFQTNTKLYSEDGLRVSFNSNEGIRAFETLTDLYLLYGVQNNMTSFYNNFRAGITPIGVINFWNYIQILYAAPEIAENWSVALAPGTMDESGNINRQQMSVDRGVLIMESSRRKDSAWEFLKWWLSDETQTEFSRTMLIKFGSDFIWNSANKVAFSRLPIPSDHRTVMMEQWACSENYRNTPAAYMLQRELSDAWYSVVQGSTPARIALNKAAVNINEELRTKMKEFNYIDADGNVLNNYDIRPLSEILAGLRRDG